MVKRLLPLIVLGVLVAAIVFFYLPNVQSDTVQVTSTQPTDLGSQDPSTWTCTGGCDLQDPTKTPTPPAASRIGTAYVTITVRFTDGSEKVLTSDFALLTVAIEGKAVSYITYKVEVAFEGLGDVFISKLLYGLYLAPATGPAYAVSTGGTATTLRAPLNTRIELVNMVVQAVEIENFMASQALPDGDYALRFWTGFFWAGTAVQTTATYGGDGGPAYGEAAISGPDLPATITVPVGGGDKTICFGARDNICIV